MRLHLDTGSSDLWLNTPRSDLCSKRSAPCAYSGTYSANSSSTYGYVGSYFNISYVDGSGASGDYVTDTLNIGRTVLSNFQFGVGYNSTSAQGILGIGYPLNEVQVGRARLDPYDNLPAAMVTQGKIATPAFSLWLNDLRASTGSILFGGVDTEQFEGQLFTLPIQPHARRVFSEFLITLTGITMGSQVIARDMALAVLLDSGSSLTYLPPDMVNAIYAEVGAEFDVDTGAAYVPCSLAESRKTLQFNFTSPTISVRMHELVLQLVTADGRRPTFPDGTPLCLFGVSPATPGGTNVLGDTFLRSAYVVYDMANNEISLAQTKFNATSSNVLEITPGEAAVPSAVAVANAVQATAGVRQGSAVGGLGTKSAAAAGTGAGLAAGLAVVAALGAGSLPALF